MTKRRPSAKAWAAFALALSVLAAHADYGQDFDVFWTGVKTRYPYLPERGVDWGCARERYRPMAVDAADGKAMLGVFEQALTELHDPHAHLRLNSDHSPKLVPSGADVWAEWRDGHAFITAVRAGFPADRAGIAPRMEVLAINGKAVVDAASVYRAHCAPANNPDADDYALRQALAGRHDESRNWRVVSPDGTQRDVRMSDDWPSLPAVSSRKLDGDIGYIRITNVGDSATVPAFDKALHALMHTRGLVLDLRETSAGGNTGVAEPILARFVHKRGNYQLVERFDGSRYMAAVSPRKPVYGQPIVVLVGRWTGSMGEGLAIGLHGLGRARVIGTPMAGLIGSIDTLRLPQSGMDVAFATEKLLHVNGTPRERFLPDEPDERYTGTDPLLAQAQALLAAHNTNKQP